MLYCSITNGIQSRSGTLSPKKQYELPADLEANIDQILTLWDQLCSVAAQLRNVTDINSLLRLMPMQIHMLGGICGYGSTAPPLVEAGDIRYLFPLN